MKPLIIFYILVVYIFAAFGWWTYFLINQTMEINEYKKRIYEYEKNSNILSETSTLNIENKYNRQLLMIISEGAVFMLLLTIGVYKIHKNFRSEIELNQQQKNFLLSITHELKSPLASIKLFLETILKRNLNKTESDKFLNHSLQDIDRLNDLVENMLFASQIENKAYTFTKEHFNLSDLSKDITTRFSETYKGKQVIWVSIQPDIQFYGDKLAISSVITNLIDNAVKYGKMSAIKVNLFKKNSDITLQVSDNGQGISDSEKNKIFKKFYRSEVNEETRKNKGTGLGLFIVKQVLDKHNSKIEINNNQPYGSIFEVTFK